MINFEEWFNENAISQECILNNKKYSWLIEHIIKVKGGYRLVSKRTGRNLGTYPTKAGAIQREREVQYFKHR